MLLLLRLMDAFIKRLGRNEKGKRNVCNISADETNKKQKRGSRYRIPFLLVRQINKREMMKEKEKKENNKKKDIR